MHKLDFFDMTVKYIIRDINTKVKMAGIVCSIF